MYRLTAEDLYASWDRVVSAWQLVREAHVMKSRTPWREPSFDFDECLRRRSDATSALRDALRAHDLLLVRYGNQFFPRRPPDAVGVDVVHVNFRG